MIKKEEIIKLLSKVDDPELKKDLVSLKMVKDVEIKGNDIKVIITLTTPACPLKHVFTRDIEKVIRENIKDVGKIEVEFDSNVKKSKGVPGKEEIPGVKNSIAITSGKGGVGKSTVSVNLAVSLSMSGAKVGICDCDIYGPNVPMMMGVDGRPYTDGKKIIPLEKHGVKVMSIDFLVDKNAPLIWRGPMLHGIIRQFLYDVDWGELDYLILDLPPGTGDAQLTIAQSLPLMGGIVVSTPQEVSLHDVRKAIMMFKKLNVPIIGIIENMSYFECPQCGRKSYLFGKGGGEKLSKEFNTELLGKIPIYEDIRELGDIGKPPVLEEGKEISKILMEISQKIAAKISVMNYEDETTFN